ncbi:MAG: serine/threonine-protein kinase [Bryobacteraceae bacterium]
MRLFPGRWNTTLVAGGMDRIGRYRIEGELGRGAMGVVYRATDPSIGRSVAIKTIRIGEFSDAAERAKLRERLFREARAAGILSHPNIVTIYDMEERGEVAYIAMECVNGPSLEKLLAGPDLLPQERMMAILQQTAGALDYAHSKGIVHRDIKPANVMLDESGAIKITDFGIAKASTSDHLTIAGALLGTPSYMSPEQVQGKRVDGSSDQYSLCVIAYEMLTGERPFMGEQLTTLVYRIVSEEAASPQRINPTLGPEIESVLMKGLAKKPDARYESCTDFVKALGAACEATPAWKSLPRGTATSQATFAENAPARVRREARRSGRAASIRTDTGRTRQRRSEEPRGAAPYAIGILAVIGLAGWMAWEANWFGTEPESLPQQVVAGHTAPIAEAAEPPPPTPKPTSEQPVTEPPAPAATEEPPPAATAEPPPVEETPPPVTPQQEQRPKEATPQEVAVVTKPPRATAVLDGRPDLSCVTPCTITAPPGMYLLTVSMNGYRPERREITIKGEALIVPPMSLRQRGGTLLLSTTPPGAAIDIDGRRIRELTPAQISLTPGAHTITLEKDGLRKAERVEIKDGVTSYLEVALGP